MFHDDDFEYEYLPTTADEIEASLNYLNEKTSAIGRLLDAMHRFGADMDRWGTNHSKFYNLHTHLCEELLKTETERSCCESDLKSEKLRISKTTFQ